MYLTLSRLAGALCLGAVMGAISVPTAPLLQGYMRLPFYFEVNVLCGVIIGWTVLGRRMPTFLTGGLSNGISGGILCLVLALLANGFIRMIDLALKMRFDNVLEAVVSIVDLGLDVLVVIAQPSTLGMFAAGALAAGLLSQFVARYVD